MTAHTHAYAARSATSPIEPFEFTYRALRADDVEIAIEYCGVCHSDIHQARNEWNGSTYPMVPGHEIVGRVARVGADVTTFRVGEMVGVGCMVDSCGECASCREGLEQYCERGCTLTYNGTDRVDGRTTYGGYAERVIVADRFVVRIPDGLDAKSAAPLLCAGITTYSPLRHWKVGPGSRVAVVGLGGLGHIGLKFAKALGAHVTLFTRSTDKQAEARRLGADAVVLSTDAAQMAGVAASFDVILDTVPHQHDLDPYVRTLKRDGTLVLLGVLQPLEPAPHGALLMTGRKAIAGSGIGGIAETQEMLDFCAANGVTCDVETIDMRNINAAYDRILASDVKYRFVIDMASLRAA